jgi:hypothetical protein
MPCCWRDNFERLRDITYRLVLLSLTEAKLFCAHCIVVELCDYSNECIDVNNNDIFILYYQLCTPSCDHRHVPGIYWPADSVHCAVTRDKYGCYQSAYLILRLVQLLPAACEVKTVFR